MAQESKGEEKEAVAEGGGDGSGDEKREEEADRKEEGNEGNEATEEAKPVCVVHICSTIGGGRGLKRPFNYFHRGVECSVTAYFRTSRMLRLVSWLQPYELRANVNPRPSKVKN